MAVEGVRRAGSPEGDRLTEFASHVDQLRREHGDDSDSLAAAVAERLKHLLRDPDWLADEYRQGWDDRYRQHVVYVAPDGGFSIVSLVWSPGQETPIHDHVAWCVVGVYQGTELETCYHLHEDAGEQFLVPVGTHKAHAGDTVARVPPDEDIHKVSNVGSDVAISIHVYGADIGRLGSSINHCFGHLPIRDQAGSAPRLRWRRVF